MSRTLVILGASGFIGQEVVQQAVEAGWQVKAMVRSASAADRMRSLGAWPIKPAAETQMPDLTDLAGAEAVIDLIQPPIPRRVGEREIQDLSSQRQRLTAGLLDTLHQLPAPRRPLLICVSGIDDLQPDAQGWVSLESPLRSEPAGFGHIGIPVRRLVEAALVPSAFVYLGTVYGPGKAFAAHIFPKLAQGKWKIPGRGTNHMPWIHVEDAARALVHIVSLDRARAPGRSYVVTDGSNITLNEFFAHAAQLLQVAHPKHVPLWLASLVVGRVMAQTMTRDILVQSTLEADPRFQLKYSRCQEGLKASLGTLGYFQTRPPVARSTPRNMRVWCLAAAALGALVIENTLLFPLSVPWMKRFTHGLPILDMRPAGYNLTDAATLFSTLGAGGRVYYLYLLWSVDLVLPALFGAFLFTAIRRTSLRHLAWLPLLAAGLDYSENVSITRLIYAYPEISANQVWLASTLTSLKHIAYGLSVALALAGLGKARHRAAHELEPPS